MRPPGQIGWVISVEDWALIRRLVAAGVPQRQVARQLGIGRSTVARAVGSDAPPRYERKPRTRSVGEPDPALVAEITGRIEQIQAAASAAAIVLPGNLRAVLVGMDEIYDQAVRARRALKAADGHAPPAARPGGPRESAGGEPAGAGRPRLSQRELDVLLAYTSGLTLDAAARQLGISPGTARTYLKRIKAKYRQAGTPVYTKLDLAAQVSVERGT
jgi:DNA-binding CsgD family transcriptional regulator